MLTVRSIRSGKRVQDSPSLERMAHLAEDKLHSQQSAKVRSGSNCSRLSLVKFPFVLPW